MLPTHFLIAPVVQSWRTAFFAHVFSLLQMLGCISPFLPFFLFNLSLFFALPSHSLFRSFSYFSFSFSFFLLSLAIPCVPVRCSPSFFS